MFLIWRYDVCNFYIFKEMVKLDKFCVAAGIILKCCLLHNYAFYIICYENVLW